MKKKSMSVREMGNLLGVKKTESYWIVHKNYFETRIIHGRMRVMVDSFEEWYKNQCEYIKVEELDSVAKTLYTTVEIADMLQITRQTAYQLIHKELFQSIKTDKGYRIVKSSFDEWLDNTKNKEV